jgi:hypothetical protein
MAQPHQRHLGKISLINGDEHKSVVATAVIIAEHGVVKIKDEIKGTYTLCGCEKPSLCMCVRWVHQYRDKIRKQSVYISDPDAAAGYAANVAKAEREKIEKEKADKTKAAYQCQTPFIRRQYRQPQPQFSPAPLRTSLSMPPLPPLTQQPLLMSPQLLQFAQQNPTPPHIQPVPKF